MSDSTENPYKSPEAEAGTINPLSNRVLTEDMVYYLKGASPWLRFFGIVGFITLGLAVVGLLVAMIAFQDAFSSISGAAGFGNAAMLIYTLVYSALAFFPVLFIFRFGGKIKSYLYSGDSADLEAAFKNNKSLWTFMGVMTIIGLAFLVLILVIGIIVGLAAALA